jgi:hypothetical protein
MNSTTVCSVEHPKKNSVDTLMGIIRLVSQPQTAKTKRRSKKSNSLRKAGCCLWTLSKTFLGDGSLSWHRRLRQETMVYFLEAQASTK